MVISALPLSLYVHIPWCVQKCPYCDFNSHALTAGVAEKKYIQALLADLQAQITQFSIDRPISSIFIGGGTPSLFSPDALENLFIGIRQQLKLMSNIEITLEANPGTVDAGKFAEFYALGITRLSIGVQSFNDRHLQSLGRIHNATQAIQAFESATKAGFTNINLDLMYGLPTQTLPEAQTDIQTALSLNSQHLSYYQLTLEPNTYFHRFPPRLPTDELIFTMQQTCQERMAAQGFKQYEVSAYAKQAAYCLHNLNYWQFGDYLGIGAGAHGKLSFSLPDNIIRTVKLKHPEHYLANPQRTLTTPVAVEQLPLEFMMNHLRLKQGFKADAYQATTGLALTSLEPALSELITDGLLTAHHADYRCTEKGWNFLDKILEKFLD